MSIKKVSKNQPDKFKFNQENLNLANKIVLNYPSRKKQERCYGVTVYCSKTK